MTTPPAPLSPTQQILRWFEYEHLPEYLQPISKEFYDLAHRVDLMLADGPEKTTCLRKLLEAKDCAVRAKISTEFDD